jgi:capsular exopolysaccharide family
MAQQTQSSEQQLHFFDYFRVVQVRWPIILLVFLLVMIATGTITFLMPKEYSSRVLIQVRQDAEFEIFQQGAKGKSWDPRFTTTQFEILQSKEILQPVIDRLDLAQKWAREYDIKSKETVYRKLLKMMSIREVRNTDLISVSILSRDKQEAADIANAIADQYQQARIQEQEAWTKRSLASLAEEVEKQRRKTEMLREQAAKIREEKGVYDLNPESVEDPMQAMDRVLLTVEEQVKEQRLLTAAARARYAELEKMEGDQIMRSIATLKVDDQTILQILPRWQESASEEARLRNAGYGDTHPMVRAQVAAKEAFGQQLKGQIDNLKSALASEVVIEEQKLRELEEELEAAREEQQAAKSNASAYYEAKALYIQAQKVLEAADTRYWTQMMEQNIPMNPAVIWEKAEPAERPSRPRIVLNMALGVFFGLVLGFGMAFFIEYLDTSVKTMEDIERYFALPVLAVVPKGTGVLMDMPPEAPEAEPYRILRTNIEFSRSGPSSNVMTLVSGGPGEGKSTTLVNLAYAFAQAGSRTLVIDADLRRPRQHTIFKVSNSKGLTDYLSKDVPFDELVMSTKVPKLDFVPSGRLPAGAIAMLASQRMADLIEEVRGRYDMVLIDAPPILGVSDSSLIVRAVDMTAIVIQHRRFPRAMLLRVKNAVLNAGGNLLGAVLNNVDIRLDQYYQYQTNYYGYHGDSPDEEKTASAKSSKSPVAAKSSRGSRDEY